VSPSATTKPIDHTLLVAGERRETGEWLDVNSPYDGHLVGRVARADAHKVELAARSARAAAERSDFPQHERAAVLERAAALVAEREEELALTIAAEAGKPIKAARIEAQRCAGTLIFSAVEARKLAGEMVPLAAAPAGEGKLGFVLRLPCGVVGAISPFNFPLNLVAHKLGPAIAAGNAVVLKPADRTPISAIHLAGILFEAGLPADWLHVLSGPGSVIGETMVESEDIGAITFTGSPAVGWGIRARAPRKRVSLELGSTAPLLIHEDGDWEQAADKATLHAFSHAGQSCISIQRILVHDSLAERFVDRFVTGVQSLTVGDPMDEATDVGPLISPAERDRVKDWIEEAVDAGAELLAGGDLVDGDRCLAPTVLSEPPRETKVWSEEIFGPLVTVHAFKDFDQAIGFANDAHYGLQAGVFTRDVGRALEAIRRLEFGGVLLNEVPTFRADQMPYGGVKDSGNTREGPAYAIRELTEERFVALQG
jgi:acyl-CoA reductase-like NAD-dependent aldehyde dehydrogenase